MFSKSPVGELLSKHPGKALIGGAALLAGAYFFGPSVISQVTSLQTCTTGPAGWIFNGSVTCEPTLLGKVAGYIGGFFGR
jgi:hypothetical protein